MTNKDLESEDAIRQRIGAVLDRLERVRSSNQTPDGLRQAARECEEAIELGSGLDLTEPESRALLARAWRLKSDRLWRIGITVTLYPLH